MVVTILLAPTEKRHPVPTGILYVSVSTRVVIVTPITPRLCFSGQQLGISGLRSRFVNTITNCLNISVGSPRLDVPSTPLIHLHRRDPRSIYPLVVLTTEYLSFLSFLPTYLPTPVKGVVFSTLRNDLRILLT